MNNADTTHFNTVQSKLEQFIKKYYTNQLIKGVLLFIAIGLLYFILTLLIEYVLWLSTTARAILFWLFVIVEFGLFIRFIAFPLLKLFNLQKGISKEEASKLIGNHFPEVNDKLLNVLQLYNNKSDSELLLASINQKAEALTPIPFKLAVNFKDNLKYLKYAAIPILILLISFFSGKFSWFKDSYKRVVNYQTAYTPPAPFAFFVVNEDLNTEENQDFRLFVNVVGKVIPENVQITFSNETYFLQQREKGVFEFVFEQPQKNITFNFLANNVTSKPYTLTVNQVPTLLDFKMILDYPNYTHRKDEILQSTGNASVPQGTKVTWKLSTKSTNTVNLYSTDTLNFESSSKDNFSASKRVYNNLDYKISTSNKNVKDYENLAFTINVIRDEYPELKLESKIDSLDQQSLYFFGQVSDDYGLNKLQLVYYPSDDETKTQIHNIPISKSNFDEFISAFPNNLSIEEGVSYNLYFQVFDNDQVNKNKSTKSQVFSYRKRTANEEEKKQLQEQNQAIKDLNKSLAKFDKQQEQLKQLSQNQKEKKELNFNDKKKLKNFLKRQEQQEQIMKQFNKKLKDNLEDFQKETKKEDAFKEELKKRLKENEEQLKKDEKLLEELQKIQDKLSKEELTEKLEKLAKQTKNQKRSLEQLVELTKRYYVSKKMEKLASEVEKLAEQQNKLANTDNEKENTKEKQDEINKKFEDLEKELDALEKDNKALKQPLKVPRDKNNEDNIKNEQQQASESLKQKQESSDSNMKSQKQQKAKKSQKAAAKKLQQMSMKMKRQLDTSAQEQLDEDIETLRQILDNLVVFSFDEEDVMNRFKTIEVNHNEYAMYLRRQNDLRSHFEHIDDSLFALSLRQPKLSEQVNKDISEVYFNIDKALAQLSENNIYQGASAQQYAVTSANNLADFLSDALDNLQQQQMAMPSPGQGQGKEGESLPDIIMSQEQLNEMMKKGMKKGKSGKPNEGKGQKEGKGKKEGKKGEKGQKGKEGKAGEKGNKGKQGKNGEGGDSQGEGKGGKGNKDSQDGFSEDINGELYKIYQQQQQIREALERRLEKEGKGGSGDAKRLLKEMEEVEMDLINKGFTNETLSKMMNLKHQLLKLENATFQQGQDQKRESEANKKMFSNTTNNQIPKAKEYFNTTEILNRQALPLRQDYKKKVQEYFNKKND